SFPPHHRIKFLWDLKDGRFWKPTPPTTCIGFIPPASTAGRKDNPAQCIVQFEETHPGKEGSFTTRASNPRVPSSLLSRASSDGIGKSTCLAESLR
ncbi:unnamed protein product, partial [Brassica rapa subsp. narinosa]